MVDKLKIDIISDVVCPWCIIGYKRLEQAIAELGIEDKVELEWQPFELNPDMPAEGEDIQEHMTRKYGSTPEQSRDFRTNIIKQGAELGFKFDYSEGRKIVNTRDAHILLEYASEHGLQTELKMRLFASYFTERKDISDREILSQEIRNLGLDVDEAMARLDDTYVRERIQEEESRWHNLGVYSVPTVVFNRSSAVTGAQPLTTFKQVLTDLIEQEQQDREEEK